MFTVKVVNDVQERIASSSGEIKREFQRAAQYLKVHPNTPSRHTRNILNEYWAYRLTPEYRLKYKVVGSEVIITDFRKKTDREKEDTNDLVISYMFLRRIIGVSGIILPFVLAIHPERTSKYLNFEPSISDYYYTSRGDFLVVLLSILGVFLFTYKGYELLEKLLIKTAAVCAFGIAFFPTTSKCDDCLFSIHTTSGGVFRNTFGEGAHLTFASIFFICLGCLSLMYFPRTDKLDNLKKPDNRKIYRNRTYKICGSVMLGCVFLLALYFLLKPNLNNIPIILILETISVIAFGFSWLVKGEAILKDK